ncbi:MAG: hypothetical protein WB764_25475 [Xanthobacteraceae bacterium]
MAFWLYGGMFYILGVMIFAGFAFGFTPGTSSNMQRFGATGLVLLAYLASSNVFAVIYLVMLRQDPFSLLIGEEISARQRRNRLKFFEEKIANLKDAENLLIELKSDLTGKPNTRLELGEWKFENDLGIIRYKLGPVRKGKNVFDVPIILVQRGHTEDEFAGEVFFWEPKAKKRRRLHKLDASEGSGDRAPLYFRRASGSDWLTCSDYRRKVPNVVVHRLSLFQYDDSVHNWYWRHPTQ